MARKRTIDRSFWRSEKVAPGLNLRRRLLCLGLISAQDDSGRLHGEACLIKAEVFPFDKMKLSTIEKDLAALADAKFLYLYEINGRKYIQLHGIHHQKLDHPTPSQIPPHPDSELLASISRKAREEVANDSPPKEPKGTKEKRISREDHGKTETPKPWE